MASDVEADIADPSWPSLDLVCGDRHVKGPQSSAVVNENVQ